MADQPPDLTIAAETDPAEVEKAHAARDLSWDTRALAANLLRIIRGAGKPYELPQQIINLGEQILKTHEKARAWAISSAMEDALHSGLPDAFDATEREEALRTIAKGSLQFAASRLLHQRAQEAAGTSEIAEGIEERERSIQRMREKFRIEQEALRPQPRKPARRSKPKRKPNVAPQPITAAKPTDRDEPEPKSTIEFMRRRRRELLGEDE